MMEEEDVMLRVHSADLHDHLVQEIGECLETGLYTDLMLRCKDGQTLHAHKLVLSAVSPYLKMLLENNDWEEIQTLEIPDASNETLSLLLEVVYNGVVEATIQDLRDLILLGHSLYIAIPMSDDLIQGLELVLPPLPPLVLKSPPKLKPRPNFSAMLANQGPRPKLNKPPMLKSPLMVEKSKILDFSAISSAMMTSSPGAKINHMCPMCNSGYSNIGSFKQHMKTHDNDEEYKEQRNQIISEMVATCYDPSSSLYSCSICLSSYNHSGNFKQHLLKHERESGSISAMIVAKANGDTSVIGLLEVPAKVHRPANRTSRTADINRKTFTCEHCGRAFNHAGNYKQHMTSHLRVPYTEGPSLKNLQLANSLTGSPSPKRLKISLDTSGDTSFSNDASLTDETSLTCPECRHEFPSIDDLENHISISHNQIEVSPTFADEIDVKGIDVKLAEKKKYKCLRCPQSFETHAWLSRHNNSVHKLEVISQSAEENGFMDWSHVISDSLNSGSLHSRSGAPTYKCKVCGKKFLTQTKLSLHFRIHSAPEDHYRFPCDICGKKFTRPQHVNRHKLLHVGARLFQCEKCNQSFESEEKLKTHVDTECEAEVPKEGVETLEEWTTQEEENDESFETKLDDDNDESFSFEAKLEEEGDNSLDISEHNLILSD